MNWILTKPIAHRGLHDKGPIPENSRKAFEEAVRNGYPVELDVQLLADGELAVFHDDSLDRITGMEGSIFEQTSASISKIRLLETDQTIPLFEEVLELIAGRIPILIEVKNRSRVGALESRLWRTLSRYNGEFAVSSFNPYTIGWFKENAPLVMRGQISSDFRNDDLSFFRKLPLRNLLLNKISRPHFISYDIRALPYWAVTRQRCKGIPVLGYSIKDESDYQKAMTCCDNIIFESFIPPQQGALE